MTSREFFLEVYGRLDLYEMGVREQKWIYFQKDDGEQQCLLRVPKNLLETIMLATKLDMLGVLPFNILSAGVTETDLELLIKHKGENIGAGHEFEIANSQFIVSEAGIRKLSKSNEGMLICWDIDSELFVEKDIDNLFNLVFDDKLIKTIVLSRLQGLTVKSGMK